MNKVLFIGRMDSPYIVDVLKILSSSEKKIIISMDSYQLLKKRIDKIETLCGITTWSWNNENANIYLNIDDIVEVFPYLYPDTVNLEFVKEFLNIKFCSQRSYGNFRLGFGVQEELFDLFLARFLGVNEIIYFDILSSLQLLNPKNQLEYRKKAYEFLRFLEKHEIQLSREKLSIRMYKIIKAIPFYESFSFEFGFPEYISYYEIA